MIQVVLFHYSKCLFSVDEGLEQVLWRRPGAQLVGLLEVEVLGLVGVGEGRLHLRPADAHPGVDVVRQGCQLRVVRVHPVVGHAGRVPVLQVEVRHRLLQPGTTAALAREIRRRKETRAGLPGYPERNPEMLGPTLGQQKSNPSFRTK